MLRTWNFRGSLLGLAVLPSSAFLGYSGRYIKPALQAWVLGPSLARLLLMPFPSAEAGPVHCLRDVGSPALLAELWVPCPFPSCLPPWPPIGLITPLPSLSLCISDPSLGLAAQKVWVPLLCLTPFLSGSPFHFSSWFWAPTLKGPWDILCGSQPTASHHC